MVVCMLQSGMLISVQECTIRNKWAKVAKKSSTYDVTHKKNAPPKQKIFFRVQSTRLADPF